MPIATITDRAQGLPRAPGKAIQGHDACTLLHDAWQRQSCRLLLLYWGRCFGSMGS